jgi:general secretion pathway protein G
MKFLVLSFVLMASEVAIPAAEHARSVAARADILGGLKTALDRFKIDCGRYPTTSEGFAGVVNCPTNFSGGNWSGPYLEAIPIDPYGVDYVYRCPGIHNINGYDLYSCGSDGISKSGGDDPDDINNWDPNSPRSGYDFTYRNQFLFGLILLALVTIPFLGVVRLIAEIVIFLQGDRDSIARHPTALIIWLLLSLVATFILFLIATLRVAG